MFLNIQIDLLILKTYYGQFTLTTKKSLHIIFKLNDIKNKWSKNFDERPHRHVDTPGGCANGLVRPWPHVILLCGSLGLHESAPNSTSIGLLFNGADHPQNCPIPLGDLDTWFLGPTRVSPETASRSVKPFLHTSASQTYTDIHRPRYVRYL